MKSIVLTLGVFTLCWSQAAAGLIFQIEHTAVLDRAPVPTYFGFELYIPPVDALGWSFHPFPEEYGQELTAHQSIVDDMNTMLHTMVTEPQSYWEVFIGEGPFGYESRARYEIDDFYKNGPVPESSGDLKGPTPILQSFEPLLSSKWENVQLRMMRTSLSPPRIVDGKWTSTQILKLYDTIVPEPSTAVLAVAFFVLRRRHRA
jgi:hypothetical protein